MINQPLTNKSMHALYECMNNPNISNTELIIARVWIKEYVVRKAKTTHQRWVEACDIKEALDAKNEKHHH